MVIERLRDDFLSAFSIIVYPFLMGSGLSAALGLQRENEEAALAQAKANIIKLTISSLHS